ncbi:MAG: hypothetical protein RL226_2386 [Bacteroidota bacterium]|jgi:DNA-binding LytR/AlgR family response regulator
MKVTIVEDERPAADRLRRLLADRISELEVTGVLDTVTEAKEHILSVSPDLVFMDIQLADGLSFHLLDDIPAETPIIFVTAYDQYAIQAFKANSIDYLLKPIKEEELDRALAKFERLKTQQKPDLEALKRALKQIPGAALSYRRRFLVKSGQQLVSVQIEDVAFFLSTSGVTFLITFDNTRYFLETPLDSLEGDLNPRDFFRVNRKCIVSARSIERIEPHLGQRLMLFLRPDAGEEVSVSRQRVKEFRDWLDR